MPDGQASHCAVIVNGADVIRSAMLLVVPAACFALLLSCGAVPPLQAGQVLDEARSGGRSAQSFPAAGEDYFHDMDGGILYRPRKSRAGIHGSCGPAATTASGMA